jgi:hypothetical protein
MKDRNKANYWIWVTRPEHYLDETGNDDPLMDPQKPDSQYLYWTCHKDTRRGDLILLYRSRLTKDIAYLLQATSDAEPSGNSEELRKGWKYFCACASIYKFLNPLNLKEIRSDPYLANLAASRGNFQQMVYNVADSDWTRINTVLAQNNRGYRTVLTRVAGKLPPNPVSREEDIERILMNDLRRLRTFGFNLELCSNEKDGISGRQVICEGHGGRIDLLCYDVKQERYVVIEIKNVIANQNTFGQISTYIGWVKKRLHPRKSVKGIVIGRGKDTKFDASMASTRNVSFIDVREIGFE